MSLVESYVILWDYARAMRYYNIRFEQILQTRSKNCEKLGKGLFNYDFSSEARKNPFTSLKIAFFLPTSFSDNHGQKSWDTFAFLGRFQIHTSPTPPLTPQTMLDACLQNFFSQLCIGWVVGELGEIFEKDAPF